MAIRHQFKTAIILWLSAIVWFFGFTPAAYAQLTEIRAGITEFDERTLKVGWGRGGGRENSIGLNAEVIFDTPVFLQWALAPKPYIGGTLNLEGNTSYGGAGFLWRQNLGDKFYGDIGIGLVIHDGTKVVFSRENLTRQSFNTLIRRSNEEISFGSRVLFRPTLTLGYRINEKWAGEVFFEHLSNGSIFGSVNEGVDNLGLRAARRF